MTNISFNRSTNLQRDAKSPSALQGVLLTSALIDTIQTISAGVIAGSSDNAYALVGPYGSGKSTTALVLHQYLVGAIDSKLKEELKSASIPILPKEKVFTHSHVLVGENSSLNDAINKEFKVKSSVQLISHLEQSVKEGERTAIFIDEMGKFLEYASEFPNEGDVYILQQIAELSHRSAGKLVLITIRHQGLMAYLHKLPSTYLAEWKKIQGRFLDLIHINSMDESVKIIYDRLKSLGLHSNKTPRSHIELLTGNSQLSEHTVKSTLKTSYQIDPILLLLIISFFKKHAQNERSIYSFLSSESEHSLNAHFKKETQDYYSVLDFYQFIVKHMEHVILESGDAEAWSKIRATKYLANTKVSKLSEPNIEDINNIIISIGLTNLYGEEVGLRASKELLATTCSKSTNTKNNEFHRLIELLTKQSIITFRSLNDAYNLWHGSTINISQRISDKLDDDYSDFDVAKELRQHFPHDRLVARRSFVETGAFRVMDWEYLEPSAIRDKQIGISDGTVACYVLTKKSANKFREAFNTTSDEGVLYLSLVLTNEELNILTEYFVCSDLLNSDQEIKTDNNARSELTLRKLHLEDSINSFLNWSNAKVFDNPKYQFYASGGWQNVSSKETVNKLISTVMDEKYPFAPHIHNELVNTDSPSAPAMMGVRTLINHLVEFHNLENLDIKGTGPEYAIYLNVLKDTGLHSKGQTSWHITVPNKAESALAVVWTFLEDEITKWRDENNLLSFADLEDLLAAPPYGVKRGLAKILIFAKFVEHKNELSLYEQDTYIPDIYKDTLERMLKLPKRFTIAFVPQNKSHTEFLQKVGVIFGVKRSGLSLLKVVSAIIRNISRLPYYTKHTITLNSPAQKLIRAVLRASSPETLLYSNIPLAIGIIEGDENFEVQKQTELYVSKLELIYKEIGQAYGHLKSKCEELISEVWDIDAVLDRTAIRNELKQKVSSEISDLIADESLRAFYNRVNDNNIDPDAWLISVVSFLANRPLEKWQDDHFYIFEAELRRKHYQVEELYRLKQSSMLKYSDNTGLSYVAHMISEIIQNSDIPDDQIEPLLSILQRHYSELENKYHEQS